MPKYQLTYTIAVPETKIVEANNADDARSALRAQMTAIPGILQIENVQEVKRYTVEYACTVYYRVHVEATSAEEAKEIIREKIEFGPDDEDGMANSTPIITKVYEEKN